jgi:hypothetical protein
MQCESFVWMLLRSVGWRFFPLTQRIRAWLAVYIWTSFSMYACVRVFANKESSGNEYLSGRHVRNDWADPRIRGCICSVLVCRLYNLHYIACYITRSITLVCTWPKTFKYLFHVICSTEFKWWNMHLTSGFFCMILMRKTNHIQFM